VTSKASIDQIRFMERVNLQNWTRIGAMNLGKSPSTALRAPSPPLGEKDGMRGLGSWRASTVFSPCARAMNPPPAPPRRGASFEAPVAGSPPGRGEGVGSWEECFDHGCPSAANCNQKADTELFSLSSIRMEEKGTGRGGPSLSGFSSPRPSPHSCLAKRGRRPIRCCED
jgi:hypothetical protein